MVRKCPMPLSEKVYTFVRRIGGTNETAAFVNEFLITSENPTTMQGKGCVIYLVIYCALYGSVSLVYILQSFILQITLVTTFITSVVYRLLVASSLSDASVMR